jgi:hypothetical protein
MPSGRYRFVRRSNSIEGFVSKRRASTDAIEIVENWSKKESQRSYNILIDEDDELVADLTWSETDFSVGTSLESACDELGIECSYEQT